ncbi:MAG: hypothetical protein E6Q68_03725 [Polynucleobacter sp.]|nr:MAG: hypothetical protein E6Q68_03725 [Polynucleobacter sp.]
MRKSLMIWCCSCNRYIEADLITGKEIFPANKHLHNLPFWICRWCNNYVGCCSKSKTSTKPLGNILSPELRNAMKRIHNLLDPLWLSKQYTKSYVYHRLSQFLGYQYNTLELKTIEEAKRVYQLLLEFKQLENRV